MALVAREMGIDPNSAVTTDFTRQRPQSPDWVAANTARRIAIYLLVTVLDVRRGEIARALGITRQAVHQTLEDIEATRSTRESDRLLARWSDLLRGQS